MKNGIAEAIPSHVNNLIQFLNPHDEDYLRFRIHACTGIYSTSNNNTVGMM